MDKKKIYTMRFFNKNDVDYNKKMMTYTMVNKTEFRYPTERYLNVVKRGYKDCNLDMKYLITALKNTR